MRPKRLYPYVRSLKSGRMRFKISFKTEASIEPPASVCSERIVSICRMSAASSSSVSSVVLARAGFCRTDSRNRNSLQALMNTFDADSLREIPRTYFPIALSRPTSGVKSLSPLTMQKLSIFGLVNATSSASTTSWISRLFFWLDP